MGKPEKDFYHISLKALIKNAEGHVLALKAVDTGGMVGYYDLPGGRIDVEEYGQPLEDVLRRELMEELGDVNVQLSGSPVAYGRHCIEAKHTKENKDIHVFYLVFEGRYLNGDIRVSSEHTGFAWIDLNTVNLKEYFCSGNLEALQMYVNRIEPAFR